MDIRVARADLEKKQLDFVLLDDNGNALRKSDKEDDMGSKVSVAEALTQHGKKNAAANNAASKTCHYTTLDQDLENLFYERI